MRENIRKKLEVQQRDRKHNLTMEVKDLDTINGVLMKETKEDTSKWKYKLYSWIGTVTIVKMSILSKMICRFSAIPIKISKAFFTEIGEKKITKIGLGSWKTLKNQSKL